MVQYGGCDHRHTLRSLVTVSVGTLSGWTHLLTAKDTLADSQLTGLLYDCSSVLNTPCV